MRTDASGWRSRSGTAILTVLGVVAAISLIAGSAAYISLQRTYMAGKLADRARAVSIAEAGASKTFTVLATNFALRTDANAFPPTSYGGGTYTITVTSAGSNQASITSQGTYGNVKEIVQLDVANVLTNASSGTPALNAGILTILAGGDMTFAGNVIVNMTNCWAHCNGSFYMNGSQTITGNVSSCVNIDSVGGSYIIGNTRAPSYTRASPGNITGTALVTNQAPVAIPDLDLTPLYNRARAYNQVFTNTTKYLSGNVAPAGGVMWVEGGLSLADGNYTGCFVATKDIELKTASNNGQIIQTKVGNYPAFVSRDGNITMKQAKMFQFSGLIYCKTGSFDKQGNGDCCATGQVITASNFSKNGGWGAVFSDCLSGLWPGSTNAVQEYKLVPIGWQK